MSHTPTIASIQKTTARHYKISVEDMKSPIRKRNIVRPRQVAMSLCKHITSRSLPQIGRKFGGRDHTTVLHAIRKIAELVEIDDALKKDYLALHEAILEGIEIAGGLKPLAKLLAPMIAEEIKNNFIIQIEQSKAETCKSRKVEIVKNDVEPELLQALEDAQSAYDTYEDAQFSRGEVLNLKQFLKSFENLRTIHRKFQDPENTTEGKSR